MSPSTFKKDVQMPLNPNKMVTQSPAMAQITRVPLNGGQPTKRPRMLINQHHSELEKPRNVSIMESELQATASDNRLRRLVPYMTFYIPSNDFNYPVNYNVSVKKTPQFFLHKFLKNQKISNTIKIIYNAIKNKQKS